MYWKKSESSYHNEGIVNPHIFVFYKLHPFFVISFSQTQWMHRLDKIEAEQTTHGILSKDTISSFHEDKCSREERNIMCEEKREKPWKTSSL